MLPILLLLALSPQNSPPSNQPQVTTTTSGQPERQRKTPVLPTPSKPAVPVKRKEQPSRNTETHRRPKRWDWTLADTINATIAAASIATLATTLWLIRMTAKANREALRLTAEALTETRRSNELTQHAVHMAHRPSLHLTGITPKESMTGGVRVFGATVALRNTGSDTAQDLRVAGTIEAGDGPEPNSDPLTPTERYGDIGATLTAYPVVRVKVFPELNDALMHGTLVRLHLSATYRDEFGFLYSYAVTARYFRGAWEKEAERHERTHGSAQA